MLFKRKLYFLITAVMLLSLGACRKTGEHADHLRELDPYYAKANRLFDSLQFERSIRYIDSVYSTGSYKGIRDQIRRYNHIRECRSRIRVDYEVEMMYIDSVLILLSGREDEYPVEYMRTLLAKGDTYFRFKRYQDSYPYYYRARLVAEKIDPGAYVDLYSERLGNAYFREGRYEEALGFYQMALKMRPVNKPDPNIYLLNQQKLLNNIGLCYERSGRPDSALYFYDRALGVIGKYEKMNPEDDIFIEEARGVVFGNIGSTWGAKGDMTKAESFLRKSIQINTRKGHDEGDAQTAALKLARLYMDHGRMSDAQWVLSALQTSLESLPDAERQLKWLELQWKYYDKAGDKVNTIKYLKTYLWQYLEIASEDRKLRGDEVSREIKSIQDRHEIELLKKETRLQSTYLLLVATLSIMGIVITFLLWRNWNQSRRNINRLTELNQKVHQQNVKLDLNNKDKDRTLKVLAHDLKNPMGGILSLSGILLDDEQLSEENRRMIQLINTSSRYATQMINDLLQASLGNQPVTLDKKPVDLYVLLHQCVDLLQFKAAEKKQKLLLEDGDHCELHVDSEKIQRVISNLIVNALKFSPEGAKVEIRIKRGNDMVTVEVIDQGIGIPENIRDKVFDMFTSAKRFGTANEQPFGLGLAISRQIVEAHKGRIWFETEEGKGTTFYVGLPL